MSELVIHIGTHKTATTTIQNTLAANRLLLREFGLHYPAFGVPTGHHVLATPWIRTLPPVYHSRTNPMDEWASIRTDTQYTFLSSEEFSRAYPNRVDMAELKALTERFDKVRILCVLRNQIEFMQSVYLEVIKNRDHWPIERFVSETLRAPDAESLFFDPNDLLAHLLEGFEKAELVFMPYQSLKRHPGGPLSAIFERLDWPIDATALEPVDVTLRNQSPDPLMAWVAHQISRKEPADAALRDLVRDELEQMHGKVRTTLFSHAECRQITEHFSSRNACFKSDINRTDPAFDIDPYPDFSDVVHRDELKGPIWFRLARALYARQTFPKQDAIRRLA